MAVMAPLDARFPETATAVTSTPCLRDAGPTRWQAETRTPAGTRVRPSRPIPTPQAAHPARERVGWGFISLYALSYAGGSLVLIAPLLVTLALKVNDLVGIDEAPKQLALVTGVGSLLAMVSNPLVRPAQRPHHLPAGDAPPLDARRSGRRHARHPRGRRRARRSRSCWPAGAPRRCSSTRCSPRRSRCCPTRCPVRQRGVVSGILGICLPVASVAGTFLVQAFDGSTSSRCSWRRARSAASSWSLFATRLHDRRLDPADRPPWSLRELAGTFYVNPRRHPDFAWAFLAGSCS